MDYCKNNKKWEVYVDQSKSSLDRGGSATLDAFMALAPSHLVTVYPAIFPQSYFTKTTTTSTTTSSSSTSSNNNNNNNNYNVDGNNNNDGSNTSKNSSKGPYIRCIAVMDDVETASSNDNSKTIKSKLPPNGSRKGTSEDNNNQAVITSFDVGNVDSVDKVSRILTKYMQLPVRFTVVIIIVLRISLALISSHLISTRTLTNSYAFFLFIFEYVSLRVLVVQHVNV